MSRATDHFIETLVVDNAYAVTGLEVRIGTPDNPRHLILTGPNGSGKSTILRSLREYLAGSQKRKSEVQQLDIELQAVRERISDPSLSSAQQASEQELLKTVERRRQGLEKLPVSTRPSRSAAGKLLFLATANRKVSFRNATGPKAIGLSPHPVGDKAAEYLLQYLVNLRTEAALAREDGDTQAAEELSGQLASFERQLRTVLGDPDLRLMFDRSRWRYWLRLGDERDVEFHHLPDGYSSVLYLWASIMLATEGLGRRGRTSPTGWALLDEPELHLHAELQERILPFLAGLFPTVQFIIATHSPAILASLANATVFDLASREAYPSEELRGVRYGTILTEHFGISSDFDLQTTRSLEQLYALYDSNPRPGSTQFKEMRMLADSLGDVPHVLVSAARKLTSRASDSDD